MMPMQPIGEITNVRRYPPGTSERVARAIIKARKQGTPERQAVAQLLGIRPGATEYHINKAKLKGLVPDRESHQTPPRAVRVDDFTWERAKAIAAASQTTVSELIVSFLRSLDPNKIIKIPRGPSVDPRQCMHEQLKPVPMMGITMLFCLNCNARVDKVGAP